MKSFTETERMTEEKAALENDVINNEMNLEILTAENKRLKAQINDLKSTKDGYKKRFLDSGHRNKKLSLKVRTLKKEIERLERVIKDKDSLCYDCKKSVEDFAEKLKRKCRNFYPSIDHYCCSEKAVKLSDIEELLDASSKRIGRPC